MIGIFYGAFVDSMHVMHIIAEPEGLGARLGVPHEVGWARPAAEPEEAKVTYWELKKKKEIFIHKEYPILGMESRALLGFKKLPMVGQFFFLAKQTN